MPAKLMLLLVLTVGLILTSCSDQTVVQPKTTLQPASDVVAVRPIRDFLVNQGTYWGDGTGGCVLFHAPVQNFLCWCDAGTKVMASVDYAAVADQWIQCESGGQMSCGTNARGQILEASEPDGTARLSVIVETKGALSWAETGKGGQASFGAHAPDVLHGKDAAIGAARLEVEFSLPAPGLPIPDLVQLLYAPLPGQEVHSIKFYARAEGLLHGKPAILEVSQAGLSNPVPQSDGIPAQVTIKWIEHSGQDGHNIK
jgi:hypothetical protein